MSTHIKAKIKEHRKTALLSALIFSLITSFVIQLFSKRWSQTPGVILGIILSFWIMAKTHEYSEKAILDNRQDLSIRHFFKPIQNWKKSIQTFGTYFVFMGIVIVVIYLLQKTSLPQFIMLLILPISFIYLNATSHVFWYKYEENESYLSNLKETFKALYNAKINVVKYAVQYLQPMVSGVLLTFMIVVLLNSFKLQEILQLPDSESGALIKEVFTKPSSEFILMTGTFIVLYYILFIGSALYADYFKQSIKKSRKNK